MGWLVVRETAVGMHKSGEDCSYNDKTRLR